MDPVDADDQPSPTDEQPREPAALVDHIVATHHRSMRRELARLEAIAGVAADVFREHPHVEELHQTVRRLHRDALRHLDVEERAVFPAVRRTAASDPAEDAGGAAALPTTAMEAEHAELRSLAGHAAVLAGLALRETGDLPTVRALVAGLDELVADLEVHQQLEDEVLFPAVAGRSIDVGFGSTTFC